MLFFLTLILSLTAIAADFIHFRRRRRRKRPVRRALVAWAAATDALPILSSIISALSRDNGTGLMHLYMWLFWAWIVTVLPRLAFYAFNFVNLRRTGYVAACASDIKNLNMRLSGGETFTVANDVDTIYASSLAKGASAQFSKSFFVANGATAGMYPITISATYDYVEGGETVSARL